MWQGERVIQKKKKKKVRKKKRGPFKRYNFYQLTDEFKGPEAFLGTEPASRFFFPLPNLKRRRLRRA